MNLSRLLLRKSPAGTPFLLALLLTLGGCSTVQSTMKEWFEDNKGGPAKLVEFSETARFEVRWHTDIGEAGTSLLQPALTQEAIYGVSGEGVLTRVDRATGRQVWQVKTGIMASGGVGSGEGLVLIGGSKGEVLAYDEKGGLRWQGQVSSEVLSAPKATEGIVIVRSGDGRIAGLDATNGKRVWLYERTAPALVVRSHAGVTLQRGVAYIGFAGGKLAAINVKDGAPLWEVSVSQPRGNTELERISDITSNPAVDDQEVCAIAFQGRVACFDIVQGGPLWNRDISSDKGMMLLRRYLYISDAGGSVIVVDKVTGSTVWKNDQLLLRDTATPYALGDFVIVGDFEGYLHAMNREDGRLVARIKLDGSAIQGAPIGLDDGLLVQTRDGDLYSLTLH